MTGHDDTTGPQPDNRGWYAGTPPLRPAIDFDAQVRALSPNASMPQQNAHSVGAEMGTHISASMIRKVMQWQEDVLLYGLDNARALQEMANTTPYSRQQWIRAWTSSTRYRAARQRAGLPVLAEWLDPMRRFLPGRTLTRAALMADIDHGFSNLADMAHRAAQEIIELALQLGMPPCRVGRGPCFCHSAPFPAARDYRRRTKHRRRRQR